MADVLAETDFAAGFVEAAVFAGADGFAAVFTAVDFDADFTVVAFTVFAAAVFDEAAFEAVFVVALAVGFADVLAAAAVFFAGVVFEAVDFAAFSFSAACIAAIRAVSPPLDVEDLSAILIPPKNVYYNSRILL